jgi:hypothetical protein
MANKENDSPADPAKTTVECPDDLHPLDLTVSPAALFGVLAADRSRYVLYHLVESDGVVSVEEMASAVAERERAAAESSAPDANSRVHTSLYHVELPKLGDYGLVEYDFDEDRVEATDRAAELAPYLQVAERLEDDEFTDRP